jgi:hypothetical protein
MGQIFEDMELSAWWEEHKRLDALRPRRWTADVRLMDMDINGQIGDPWSVEVEATSRREARRLIVNKAYDDVDGRLNDVYIEVISGPKEVEP